MSDRPNFTERVADLFKSMPGQWIDAGIIAQVGGRFASRTRISECRTRLGMDIRNRTRREDTPLGSFTVSEYCYFPTPPAQPVGEAQQDALPWEAA